MVDLDYKQFHTRCKPTSSNKQNYTEEERKQILEYLSSKKDIYSQAIKLAFYPKIVLESVPVSRLQIIQSWYNFSRFRFSKDSSAARFL